MIKKLILPIILGVLAFGAAFGGAFFLHGYLQGKSERDLKAAIDAGVAALRVQGRVTVLNARLVAVVAAQQDNPAAPAAQPALVPGAVRYELDGAAIRPGNVKWLKEKKILAVMLPALSLAGPAIDYADARQIGPGGQVMKMPDAALRLDEHDRITVQVSLIEQARAAGPMGQAKQAARKLAERSFAAAFRDAGIKAAVEVHFPGEAMPEDEDSEEN